MLVTARMVTGWSNFCCISSLLVSVNWNTLLSSWRFWRISFCMTSPSYQSNRIRRIANMLWQRQSSTMQLFDMPSIYDVTVGNPAFPVAATAPELLTQWHYCCTKICLVPSSSLDASVSVFIHIISLANNNADLVWHCNYGLSALSSSWLIAYNCVAWSHLYFYHSLAGSWTSHWDFDCFHHSLACLMSKVCKWLPVVAVSFTVIDLQIWCILSIGMRMTGSSFVVTIKPIC